MIRTLTLDVIRCLLNRTFINLGFRIRSFEISKARPSWIWQARPSQNNTQKKRKKKKKKPTRGPKPLLLHDGHERGGPQTLTPGEPTTHTSKRDREREEKGRVDWPAMPGVRRSHGRGSGGKREKERRSEKRRVDVGDGGVGNDVARRWHGSGSGSAGRPSCRRREKERD